MRYPIEGAKGLGGRFAAMSVILLTALIILSGCAGGGGGAGGSSGATLSGSSGSVCLSDDYNYTVEVEGGSTLQYSVEADPLAQKYEGNIGGQIRGVASQRIALEGGESQDLLLWGVGASIKYGTSAGELDKVRLKNPGAVMDIAPVTYGGNYMIVYGSERGVGAIGAASSGDLVDMAGQGAWRSVPAGVLSLDASSDGSRIAFTSRDGLLQQLSMADLLAGSKCSGILARKVTSEEGGSEMTPVKVQLGDEHAFLLSRLSSAVLSSAPTFSQAYHPVFNAMINGTALNRVSAIKLSDGSAVDVGAAAADGTFDRFDTFIPMDISSDGKQLFVVGLAFQQASVAEFLATKCSSEEDVEDPVGCMEEAARDGSLATFSGESTTSKFTAGFFVYRDMADLSKADHFQDLRIAQFSPDADAPPFLYAIAGEGDMAYVRAANFMMALFHTGSETEVWEVKASGDSAHIPMTTGVPNRVAPYEGDAVSTFTAVRQPDGSGASELEYTDIGTLSFSTLDTGAIFVRVDGAGESTGLVSAIEMRSSRGGRLFLENAVSRTAIDQNLLPGSYVSRAAYDGSRLAFAWSTTASEATQPWNIAIQAGTNEESRGTANITRSDGSQGEFVGFPLASECSGDPNQCRGVGGMALSEDGFLAVLLTGYLSGNWHNQVLLYQLSSADGVYAVPTLVGVSTRIPTPGTSTSHAGAILGVRKSGDKYKVIFSTPDSVRSWEVKPTSPPSPGTIKQICKTTASAVLVDASMDAMGSSKVAIVVGNTIIIKDIDNPSAEGVAGTVQMLPSTTLDRLIGARVAFIGSRVAIATPYGAANTFSLYGVDDVSISLLAGTKLSRFFDVKAFSFYPTYLLASSQAGGIEIYDLSQSQ